MNIDSSTILITGGGQGLGRAMAVALAARGAGLALVDLDRDKLEETASLCEQVGGSARSYVANIAREDEVETLFDRVCDDFGELQGLVNNAGIIRDGLLIKVRDGEITDRLSLAEWQAVIDVNLTGVFLCGREAATRMIRRGNPGLIINISSISRAGNIGQSNYSAAKAGVVALTTTWARELARFGIRCAAIAPGVVATNMTAGMKPEALERLVAAVPAGRLAQPEEIAATVVFLFENDYVNGRVFSIDGGLRL